MRVTRTARQMRAVEHRGELAGGEELLLQWWSGLRRSGGGASEWGTASISPQGVAVKRARGRGSGSPEFDDERWRPEVGNGDEELPAGDGGPIRSVG